MQLSTSLPLPVREGYQGLPEVQRHTKIHGEICVIEFVFATLCLVSCRLSSFLDALL